MSEETKKVVATEVTQQDVEFLQTQCREVWWTCKRLPSSKQVAKVDKKEMVATTEGNVGGFSISKRIFNSKHPAIKKVNELFRDIDELRDSFTIVKSAAVSESNNRFQVDPGRRIIRVTDIEDFEKRFIVLKEELSSAVKKVAYCVHNSETFEEGKAPVESIVEMDKKQLGRSFSLQDYPTEEELSNNVSVTLPQYGNLQVDKLLPASVLERETERIQQELGDTVALATQRIVDQIVEAFETLARSLSHKEILNPLPNDEFATEMMKHHPVEVSNVFETRHDRSIPPDSVKIELIYKEVQEDKDAATKKVTISKVVTRSYYNETLRPVKTDARRQLRETAVDKIFQTFEWLQQVQPMIGENGVIIQKSLANVKTVLDQLKSSVGSSTEMIQELKTSAFVASKVKESLVEAVASLASQSEEVIHTRARRKLLV